MDNDEVLMAEIVDTPPPGRSSLVFLLVALVLPIVAGVALIFLHSVGLALLIIGLTVLATATLLAIDAYLLGRVDLQGRQHAPAEQLFFGLVLLWIVFYPMAVFRRRQFGGPSLGLVALLAVVCMMGGPLLAMLLDATVSEIRPDKIGSSLPTALQSGVQLPAITSPEVVQATETSIRQLPIGPRVKKIDGYRETGFNAIAESRRGQCVVHVDDQELVYNLNVTWADLARKHLSVAATPAELPACASPEIIQTLAQIMPTSVPMVEITSIDGHRETKYDAAAHRRLGQCVVHTAAGDREVAFVIEWINRDMGAFIVRVMPTELPACTSPDVMRLTSGVVRRFPFASRIKSVDGFEELGFDSLTECRRGKCVVHLDDQDVVFNLVVRWADRSLGQIMIQAAPAELPKCDSPEVVAVLQKTIAATMPGVELTSIDGVQETEYDPATPRRHGQCVAHTPAGDRIVPFFIMWTDRDTGQYVVRVPPSEVPPCDSPDVINAVETAIRQSPIGKSVRSITDYRELGYDREANQRNGQCTVHLEDRDRVFNFAVRWRNKKLGQFEVLIAP